jgi:hypothetical protein
MSSFSHEFSEKIKNSIKQTVNYLNICIEGWFTKNNLKNLINFESCCTENEIQILIDCYTIFSNEKK